MRWRHGIPENAEAPRVWDGFLQHLQLFCGKLCQSIDTPVMLPPGRSEEQILADGKNPQLVGPRRGRSRSFLEISSPFFGTNLESILRSRDIDTVVLIGVATEFVVESAARHAADVDFQVIVLENFCAGFSDETHRVSLHIMNNFAWLATSADFLQSI